MKQYLTAAQFAARAGLHLRTVQTMAARGEIEAIRIGGPHSQLRISEEAAADWEASRRKASA